MVNLLNKGSTNRHVGETKMNITSSRSHSIFTIQMENRKQINGIEKINTSKMNFVDLAGSEK